MDIKRTKRSHSKRKVFAYVGISGLLMMSVWFGTQSAATVKLPSYELLIKPVQRGSLTSNVGGYGVFESRYQRLLTTEVDATIEEIKLRPGAQISEGDVILTLINKDLTQELEDQKIEVVNQEAQLQIAQLNNQREILSLESQLKALESEYHTADLKLQAVSELSDSGVVSKIEYQSAVLNAQQLKQRVAIEKNRMSQLKMVHLEVGKVQRKIIDKEVAKLKNIQRRFDSLNVRASESGVLLRLPVELGQRVNAGDQLALIGSVHELLAKIEIPQTQISKIVIGMPVVVLVGDEPIDGVVSRIEPEVRDGMVAVEVILTGELPTTARPDMNIEAIVNTGLIENALYIERPINAKANSRIDLFVVGVDTKKAVKKSVQLGVDTGKFIQIISGVSASEQIILSDMSKWQEQESITLTY